MESVRSINRIGSLCCFALVGLYVIAGVTFLLLPVKGSVLDPLGFAKAYMAHRALYKIFYLSFGLIPLFTFGAIPAISGQVRKHNEGLVKWTSSIAYLGYGVLALNFFRLLGIIDMRTEIFLSLDEAGQNILAAAPLVMDQHCYLTFGATGFWYLTIGGILFKTEGGLLGALGILLAIVFELVVIGWSTPNLILLSGLATVGGVVIGPVWFGLMGQRLSSANNEMQEVPAQIPVATSSRKEKPSRTSRSKVRRR